MKTFVKLTTTDQRPIWIRADAIQWMKRDAASRTTMLGTHSPLLPDTDYTVLQTPDEILEQMEQ